MNETSANSPRRPSPSTSSTTSPDGGRRRASGNTYSMDRPVISRITSAVGVSRRGEVAGDGAAVLEHRDPVADPADLLEPVRDVDDRDAGRGELADHAEQVVDLVGVEHRGRLVHHDQPRVPGQRPRHAHDLLARRRQPAQLAARRDLGVAEPAQQRPGRVLRGARPAEPEAGGLVAEDDVLRHRRARARGRAPGRWWRCRRRRRRAASRTTTGSPAQRISPASGRCAPASTLISVDLPAPFWPSRQCTSPAATSRSTPSSARTPGNSLTMPRICSSGRASSGSA